ncbi:hypothetical protein [Cyprinid herpesvirus 2]|uniref:Uncharacterized protein n=1 Tax=Cyprinid herpesvirus 2 TaxID=317878 RepID=A0A0E3XA07_CYHV2|nr:hypothetical protein [Cyprinid herpesvirus 2]
MFQPAEEGDEEEALLDSMDQEFIRLQDESDDREGFRLSASSSFLNDDMSVTRRDSMAVAGGGSEQNEDELPNFQRQYTASALETSGALSTRVSNPIKTGYCPLCAAHCMPQETVHRRLEEALLMLKNDIKGAWSIFQTTRRSLGTGDDNIFRNVKLVELKRHLLYHSIAQTQDLAEETVARQLISEMVAESDALRTHMVRTFKLPNNKTVRVLNKDICAQLNTNRKLILDSLKLSSNARARKNTTRMQLQIPSTILSIQQSSGSTSASASSSGGSQGTPRIRELPST